jgi:hypothetical protein
MPRRVGFMRCGQQTVRGRRLRTPHYNHNTHSELKQIELCDCIKAQMTRERMEAVRNPTWTAMDATRIIVNEDATCT